MKLCKGIRVITVFAIAVLLVACSRQDQKAGVPESFSTANTTPTIAGTLKLQEQQVALDASDKASENNVEKPREIAPPSHLISIDLSDMPPIAERSFEKLKEDPSLFPIMCPNEVWGEQRECLGKQIEWTGMVTNTRHHNWIPIVAGPVEIYVKVFQKHTGRIDAVTSNTGEAELDCCNGPGVPVRVVGGIGPKGLNATSITELKDPIEIEKTRKAIAIHGARVCEEKFGNMTDIPHETVISYKSDRRDMRLGEVHALDKQASIKWASDRNIAVPIFVCEFEHDKVARVSRTVADGRNEWEPDRSNMKTLFEARRGPLAAPPKPVKTSLGMTLAELKAGANGFFRQLVAAPKNDYNRTLAGICSVQMDEAEKAESMESHFIKSAWKTAYDVCEGQVRSVQSLP